MFTATNLDNFEKEEEIKRKQEMIEKIKQEKKDQS